MPQPYMPEHSPHIIRPHLDFDLRSDPHTYSGAGGQPSFGAGRYQVLHCQSSGTVQNSRVTGGLMSLPVSTTSIPQRPPDSIASGLACLRRTAEQPVPSFGMFLSDSCLKVVYVIQQGTIICFLNLRLGIQVQFARSMMPLYFLSDIDV